MVWHLRTPSLRPGECHCELELLLTKNMCNEFQRQNDQGRLDQVRDWRGKLASVVCGEQFGFNERTQMILKAMIVDASSCS